MKRSLFSLPFARRRQEGVAAVEFAFTVGLFLLFLLGVIEMARALYLWSSMIEVTRRAARGAANADFSSSTQLSDVRNRAMLPIGVHPTASNLQIEYLNASLGTPSPMPACPARNIAVCTADSEAPGCVRFVRVRLCSSSAPGACSRVAYQSVLGPGFFPPDLLQFPTFATVSPAGTLGYVPGSDTNCN